MEYLEINTWQGTFIQLLYFSSHSEKCYMMFFFPITNSRSSTPNAASFHSDSIDFQAFRWTLSRTARSHRDWICCTCHSSPPPNMHFTDQYAFTLIQLYSGSFIFINLIAKLNNFSCAWLIVPTLKVFGVNHWLRQEHSFDLFPDLYLHHILKWAVQNANIIFFFKAT